MRTASVANRECRGRDREIDPCLCVLKGEHETKAKSGSKRKPAAAALRARGSPSGPEAKAKYRFRDRRLLETALTHRSYLHEHNDERSGDFERLEFLGDAVIDLVVAERLYKKFPDLHEGELTAIRASLVSGNALAPIGVRLALPKAARLGRGEEESSGRERAGLAASLFESFVGAVYLDGGYESARVLVERAMARELRGLQAAPPKSGKTLLQEWVQAQHLPLPRYLVVEVRGPEHQRDFRVAVEVDGRVAEGSGMSKREAEEAAASALLDKLTA
ncbi:MAG: ribonuclease III [Chloroflexi bacterium]|nr:MAG: ribonuclease III [Chloroflexota bacterium]